MPPGTLGFRLNLYDKGWRPWEVKRLLHEYPQEALFLSVYLEETQAFQAEETNKIKKGHRSSAPRTAGAGAEGPGDWRDDDVLGGDDELDWHEWLKQEAEE